MAVECEIKFDENPNGIYFAGQTLSGTVELTIDKPKKIRALILKIEGFAKVQWSETQRRRRRHLRNDNRSRNKTVTYSGREDYLNTISYLIGSPEGNQIEIAAGAYQYNFQAVLPPLLPTSFEAKHGSIRYLVNVVIDRPWKFDLTYKVAFTVLKQLDLNYENPALKVPSKMELSKTFFCLFCRTAPLFIAASIPMSGYVAGQSIAVSIDINNQSRINIDDIRVSLKKIILYNSQLPSKKTKEEILQETVIKCGGVQKRKKGKFDQNILIPAVGPSNTNYCQVLTVSYEIHVTAKMPGMVKNPVLKLPITIGTVPLSFPNHQLQQNTLVSVPLASSQTPSPSHQYSLSEAMASRTSNGDYREQFFSLIDRVGQQIASFPAPPTYHEAMGSAVQLNEEGEHTFGNQPFHPMYPVYNFNNNNQTLRLESPSTSSPSPQVGIQNSGFVGDTITPQSPTPAPGSISDSAIIQKY